MCTVKQTSSCIAELYRWIGSCGWNGARRQDGRFQDPLLLDSRVLHDQQLNERRKQRFASLADIVHELEEPQVDREFLLGNAPMRTQPTPQERPKAFHGIHMDFTKTVAIVIASEFASSVVDTLMAVAPGLQTGINAVLVRVHQCPWINDVFDERLDRLLLHIGKQINHHLPPALHHPKDGRSFLRQGASTSFAFESAPTTCSALALDYLWLPFMAGNHIGFVALHLIGERHCGLFFTIPSRSCAVICCTSLPWSANS